ncbi:MAG: hypothetical protein VYB54_10320 [Pseudomonadota bacterium]|nr:hypothetical protein [Pseudomonadota bacterium]
MNQTTAIMPWPGRMSADKAAAYLGISKSQLLKGVKAGTYPAPVTDGRRKLWHLESLNEWLDRERQGMTRPKRKWSDAFADLGQTRP